MLYLIRPEFFSQNLFVMNRIIKTLSLLLIIAASGIGAKAQDTPENRYLIENAILGYYYTQLCSEQGSLASIEQQKEFQRKKFEEQNFERLQDPFSLYFIYNKEWYNQLTGASSLEDESLLWGDMRDAEYFTLHFDNIKFDYPHQATVKAHIDYGVRTVNMVYGMHCWNDRWWIDDIVIPQKPFKWLSYCIITGDLSDEQVAKVEKSDSSLTEEDGDDVYNIALVDEQPQFPGGAQAMYEWIADNIQYPADALAEGIQGKVIVELVIDQDGKIVNPRVLRGRHPDLDKEALRVVKSMPAWTPARVKGKLARCWLRLPVCL